MAVSKSTISPLRTPREGAWPTPRTLIVPSGRLSPTTTQIFEVPISRPTIKSLLAISLLLLSLINWHSPPHFGGAGFRVSFTWGRTFFARRKIVRVRLGGRESAELRRRTRGQRFHDAGL